MNEIKVAIADDHEMIIEGLKSLIKDVSELNILFSASDGLELLERIKVLTPDVVLLDIDMPKMDGIEATSIIKREYPTIKIIALTVHKELGIISKLKELDIDGYLLKNTTKDELLTAIKSVNSGNKYYSIQITDVLFNAINEQSSTSNQISEKLTDRELEILKLIAAGYSNTEIGKKLFISHRTVDTHRTNLMKKIKVNNIAGLIKFAFENKLIS